MDMLRAMQVFVRVVELGSLSAVARERHTTQPTVSKLVAALEDRLGVRLLERSTTHVVPTEQGRRFHERARRMLEDFDTAVADARGLTETPAGLLRVTAPVSLGVLRLNRLVQEFMRACWSAAPRTWCRPSRAGASTSAPGACWKTSTPPSPTRAASPRPPRGCCASPRR
jgi:Transcriptional regulator